MCTSSYYSLHFILHVSSFHHPLLPIESWKLFSDEKDKRHNFDPESIIVMISIDHILVFLSSPNKSQIVKKSINCYEVSFRIGQV